MRIKVPLYAVKGFLCALPISLALAVLVLGGVRLYVEHVTYPADRKSTRLNSSHT